MTSLIIRHTVEDYDAWKPHFDDHEETRREFGSRGYRLYANGEDPNDLTMVFDWDSVEGAQAFLEESDLEDVMAEAGVIGEPEFQFVEELESMSAETPMA